MRSETIKTELSADEKKYFAETYKSFAEARQSLDQAQVNFAQKDVALSGFAQYMKAKYNLSNDVKISADGEILD